ncbi:hypothetical protein DIPPA_01086 [Diplonema papillatum]|nr:hypothetical protein DIPPA_01086 [Diplonema papillatum]
MGDCNAPHSPHSFKRLLVLATVPEAGHEQGDKSRTHRLPVRKTGCLFVLTLAEGAGLTPQILSRAHSLL